LSNTLVFLATKKYSLSIKSKFTQSNVLNVLKKKCLIFFVLHI